MQIYFLSSYYKNNPFIPGIAIWSGSDAISPARRPRHFTPILDLKK
jgi:hypothetical protein